MIHIHETPLKCVQLLWPIFMFVRQFSTPSKYSGVACVTVSHLIDCLFNCLFGQTRKEPLKISSTSLCVSNTPRQLDSPHKKSIKQTVFPCHIVTMPWVHSQNYVLLMRFPNQSYDWLTGKPASNPKSCYKMRSIINENMNSRSSLVILAHVFGAMSQALTLYNTFYKKNYAVPHWLTVLAA